MMCLEKDPEILHNPTGRVDSCKTTEMICSISEHLGTCYPLNHRGKGKSVSTRMILNVYMGPHRTRVVFGGEILIFGECDCSAMLCLMNTDKAHHRPFKITVFPWCWGRWASALPHAHVAPEPCLQESEWPDIDERFLEGGDVGRFHQKLCSKEGGA